MQLYPVKERFGFVSLPHWEARVTQDLILINPSGCSQVGVSLLSQVASDRTKCCLIVLGEVRLDIWEKKIAEKG